MKEWDDDLGEPDSFGHKAFFAILCVMQIYGLYGMIEMLAR